ncbi:MAG: D-aminoacyl-tRNA deacylase [Candidatus Eisenbacteria bacterium]|nr:D-aminoacyl-tRNA deacylase [Candidatus Eisenbacteria bacterium]
MKAVVQRVRRGSVLCDGRLVSSIGPGLVILVGVAKGDSEKDAAWLASKCANLRIFEDGEGKMNLSLKEIQGEALVVSQFTLLGDARKGRRPSFDNASEPALAEALYGVFIERLAKDGVTARGGKFRTKMIVEIENEGPVTIILDSREKEDGSGVS